MPDFLLELFSEEIPARMQARAAEDLRKLVTDALVERGLAYEGAKAFATPRRLALIVGGLPVRQPDRHEERRGPRVGAPDKALEGFLKAAGLASIGEAIVQSDPKGDFYVARIHRHGHATADVIAAIMPDIVRGFPWPKSMRWGAGSVRWVRPLHSIVATFASPDEEPEVIRFEVDGVVAGDVTRGHRVHAPDAFRVRRFDDYVEGLHKAHVVLDPERRRDTIRADARTLAQAQNLELVEDEGLIDEVAGLVEWPVTLMGTFEEEFLDVPDEAIRATIRANQKCFVLQRPESAPRGKGPARVGAGYGSLTQGRDAAPDVAGGPGGKAGRLVNRFILVANLEAADGGAAIVHGNERVVRARLSDARFFWETDKKTTLEARLEKLKAITFHEKLGTQYERVERIARLARELAPLVGADPGKAETAARLAKADLVTEMVGEFPELQGLMGRYYALEEGLDPEIAAAIEEHYKPVGPSDRAPSAPVSIAVALADKIDTLVGFWAIDEKPTGSKDPYALRRAALGVVRIVLENGLRIKVDKFLVDSASLFFHSSFRPEANYVSLAITYDPTQGWQPTIDFRDAPYRSIINVDGFLDRAEPEIVSALTGNFDLDDPDEDGEDVKTARRRWESVEKLRGRLIELDSLSNAIWFEDLTHEVNLSDVSRIRSLVDNIGWLRKAFSELAASLLAFLTDRLKVQLREQGARHDLVDAALGAGRPSPLAGEGGVGGGPELSAAGDVLVDAASGATPTPDPFPQGGGEQNDDLVLIVRRVEALGTLLETDDGKNLLAGYKRAANILRAEEKKDGAGAFEGEADQTLFADDAEIALAAALDVAEPEAGREVRREDFAAATAALAKLRPAVDAFFDRVMVNAPEPAVRANRLRLLARLRRATRAVADFDRIAG